MIPIKITKISEDAKMPTKATAGSNAYDLHATHDLLLFPHEVAMISTGLKMAIPPNYVGLICPRSGLAFKHKVTVANAPGVIDSDYRGEVRVLLFNHEEPGDKPVEVKKNDRIAQILFVRTEDVQFDEVTELDNTVRGEGGFGHSGQ